MRQMSTAIQNARLPLVLLAFTILALAVSAIRPFDWLTWVMETAPVIIAIPLLLFTWNRFPLTPLLYVLIFVHALVLILGAHYSYARVPPGFWVQEWFDFERNHYDRLGHIAQGFIPAILAREILLRHKVVRGSAWLFVVVTAICLAFSAFYEMLEWWAALIAGDGATEFLATQGDVWDTQWDMFLALCGAMVSQILLGRWHNRQLARLS
ncbi:MAG: DUF2238 domain-containing protein [Gammaproteobacteria bacterium]|nr:DUF2238 domain-containing protein [Gammaproteobacteria bacterium]